MKKIYSIVSLLIISISVFAQQPYYNDINTELTTLTGIPLKNALATKITNTHTNTLSYSQIWTACEITDEDPSNSANVLLIYGYSNTDGISDTDISRLKSLHTSGGSSSGTWNREHTYAKSLGTPNLGTTGPGADAHHLRSADAQRNSARGSLKFIAGSGNSGTTGTGWYPGDQWKGDVARMMMYMWLRYGNRCLPSNVAIGTANSVEPEMINLLLQWNAQDPPSAIEDARNTYHDGTGTYAQGNRNPFIDEPYLATLIWGGTAAQDRWGIYGGGSADTQAPTVPTNLAVSNETSTTIDLNWTASTDDTAVTGYDVYVDGAYNSSSSTNSITVTGLTPSTTYSFTVLAKDAANNMSAQSAAVNGTTLAGSGGGGGSELFFSEYMEGSSNNKALEIANITGSTVDLSIYTIKKSVNGAASWDTTVYSFPASAQIVNSDVYVVANSFITVCNSAVDDSSTSSVLQFNGNDPVGLFKNDVLIDIIGTLGSSANFAKNTTLVRKSTITSPNTVYTPSEWDSFPSDTCTDLGSHTTTLGVDSFELSKIKIYPNPAMGNALNIATDRDLNVSVFNILGKQILSDTISNNNSTMDISSLDSGIYFVKLSSDEGAITRKFIKK